MASGVSTATVTPSTDGVPVVEVMTTPDMSSDWEELWSSFARQTMILQRGGG